MRQEHPGPTIAAGGLVLGIATDLLLRWIPPGLNVALWTLLFLIAAFIACRAAGRGLHPFAAATATLAGLGVMWRDSAVLVALDVAFLLLFLPMLPLGARGVRMAAAGLSQIAAAVVTTGFQVVAGFAQLVTFDLPPARLPSMRGTGVAVRGVAMAAPALILFGTLLTSADDHFAKLLGRLVDFELREIALHLLIIAVATILCAGAFRSFALSGAAPQPSRPSFLRLPATETNIAIGLINLLFATFVAVQFRYFFGASDLSESESARRGFFELVWVVGLVVPMLLAVEWLVDKSNGTRAFRLQALLMVALVLVIGASAYRRMQLYRDAFGLTQLRLYTTALMIWIGAVLVWLAVTVLTGRRERFAIGALATAVLAVVVLHAINPDALIVTTNLERARSGRRAFDSAYALRLSDDAAPVIFANAEAFDPVALRSFAERQRPRGWRTWNVSRGRLQ